MRSIISIVTAFFLLIIGACAYAASSNTQPSLPATLVTKPTPSTANITLYTTPDTKSKVVSTVPMGQALVIIMQQKDWIKVADPRNGDVGWVQQQALTQNVNGVSLQTPLINQYVVTQKNKDGTSNQVYRVINYSGSPISVTVDQKQMQAYIDQFQAQQRLMQENFNKSMSEMIQDFNKQQIQWQSFMNETFKQNPSLTAPSIVIINSGDSNQGKTQPANAPQK